VSTEQAPSRVQLSVRLELDPTWWAAAGGPAVREAATGAVHGATAQVLDTLGIPADPVVEVVAVDPSNHGGSFLRVLVDGRLAGFPVELPRRVASFVTLMPLRSWEDEEEVDGQAMEPLRDADQLAAYLGVCVGEILKEDPGLLVGPETVDAFAPWLTGGDPAESLWLLREVVRLGISLAGLREAETLPIDRGGSRSDRRERIVRALRPDVVEVRLPGDYLATLTASESGKELFPFLREGLFNELGVTFPPFRFVAADDLQPRTFAFRLNHLLTTPWVGLELDECLVDAEPAVLTLFDVSGTPAASPDNGSPSTLVSLADRQQVEGHGFTLWDPFQYLILCLAITLRGRGYRLMDASFTEGRLAEVEASYPALGEAVRSLFTVSEITDVLRSLVAEGVPIGSLRAILDRLLEYHLAMGKTPGDPLSSDSLVGFVRVGMRRVIGKKFAGAGILPVLLMGSEEEASLYRHRDEDPAELGNDPDLRRLMASVSDRVRAASFAGPSLAVLASREVRPILRRVLAPWLPRVPVLTPEEIPLETEAVRAVGLA
jgi:hypothetical protein